MNEKNTLMFIDSLNCSDGTFKFSSSISANIYSTCFAVLSLNLVEKLCDFSKDYRESIAAYIKKHQNKESGIFSGHDIQKSDTDFHNQEYVDMQLTDFSLLALKELNSKPLFQFKFLEKFKNEDYLKNWLEHLNWKDPWKVSNLIMFILNFLIYENENLNGRNDQYIKFIINWLSDHQDPKNGLWNLGYKSSYINQLAGAYHFLFFYTYLNKKPEHIEKIIDSVLSVQNYDGLFTYWGGGGSCEDLDAIDLLCRCSFYTDYRKEDIKYALRKAYAGLLKNQNEDGGFCWAKRSTFSAVKISHIFEAKLLKVSIVDFAKNAIEKIINQTMVIFLPSRLTWQYSGIKSMEIEYGESDIWSTWFRLIAVAFIEETFPEIVGNKKTFNWNFRKTSGLGFYKNNYETT